MTITVEQVKLMVKEAARIREESYDRMGCDKWVKNNPHNYWLPNFYGVSLHTACEQACVSAPGIKTLVHLALSQGWNDALEWADSKS